MRQQTGSWKSRRNGLDPQLCRPPRPAGERCSDVVVRQVQNRRNTDVSAPHTKATRNERVWARWRVWILCHPHVDAVAITRPVRGLRDCRELADGHEWTQGISEEILKAPE